MTMLDKLPKTKASNVHLLDAAIASFIQCLERGDDPYTVLDDALVHYYKVKVHYFSQLNNIPKGTKE